MSMSSTCSAFFSIAACLQRCAKSWTWRSLSTPTGSRVEAIPFEANAAICIAPRFARPAGACPRGLRFMRAHEFVVERERLGRDRPTLLDQVFQRAGDAAEHRRIEVALGQRGERRRVG